MNLKYVITTEPRMQMFIGELRKLFSASGYVHARASDQKPRSLNQNALSHLWYQQVSVELGEYTALGVRCECKLRYGVPILRADDEEFRDIYDSTIKLLTYEQKLKAMVYFPVTSLMNVGQLSRYLDAVKEAYDGRVALQFPDEYVAA